MTELSVTQRVLVNASAACIWRAITSPDDLVAWYAPGCRWEVPSLRPGAEVRFFNTEMDVQTAIVEAVEAPHRLVLRWRIDPHDPSATIVNSFLLQPAGVETEVTVSQSGYETLAASVQRDSLEQDRAAVAAIALSLKAYAEARNQRD